MGYLETQTTLWCQHITPASLHRPHSKLSAHIWCPLGFCYNLHQADPGILIWPVLGSPLGSFASPTPSLSRLVIHGISLALILHRGSALTWYGKWFELVLSQVSSFVQPYMASLFQAKQQNSNTHTSSFCSHNNPSTQYSENQRKLPYIPCL